jgi:hypothetical protein
VSIHNTDSVFDFTNSATEAAFVGSGRFDLDSFFLDDGGLTGAALAALFDNPAAPDTFDYEIGRVRSRRCRSTRGPAISQFPGLRACPNRRRSESRFRESAFSASRSVAGGGDRVRHSRALPDC